MDKISVIICTKNRPKDIERCVESISMQSCKPFEILIIDSSTNEKTEKLSYAWNEKIEIKYYHTDPGLTKQRNIGVSLAKGDIFAFFDDDVILSKDYFQNMINYFSENPTVSGANGYLINYEKVGLIFRIVRKIFMLTSEGKSGKMKKSGFADFLDPRYVKSYKKTNILAGYNMIFRKSVFEKYLFDESLEGSSLMEDVQFSNIVSKSFKLVCLRNASIIHQRSESERVNNRNFFKMLVYNHFLIFYKDVKKSNVDWFFYFYSQIGILLMCFYWTIKLKNMLAFSGLIDGYLDIINSYQSI